MAPRREGQQSDPSIHVTVTEPSRGLATLPLWPPWIPTTNGVGMSPHHRLLPKKAFLFVLSRYILLCLGGKPLVSDQRDPKIHMAFQVESQLNR